MTKPLRMPQSQCDSASHTRLLTTCQSLSVSYRGYRVSVKCLRSSEGGGPRPLTLCRINVLRLSVSSPLICRASGGGGEVTTADLGRMSEWRFWNMLHFVLRFLHHVFTATSSGSYNMVIQPAPSVSRFVV